MNKIILLSLILLQSPVWAALEVGYFATQRNSFAFSSEDTEKAGLGVELSGSQPGNSGLSSQFHPWGLELGWYRSSYGNTGPLARARVAPAPFVLRKGSDVVPMTDSQLALGHGWNGPEIGALKMAFELGLLLRQFSSSNEDRIPSSGFWGMFSGGIVRYDLWTMHLEAALVAFPLGGQGRWGTHRDSNSLRIRGSRQWSDASPWRPWVEFYHLHRTFGNSQLGPSKGYFWSDVSLSVGLNFTWN